MTGKSQNMCPNPDPARYNRCSRTSSDTEAALNEPTAEMVPKRCPPVASEREKAALTHSAQQHRHASVSVDTPIDVSCIIRGEVWRARS
mmetsp:Transcript_25497/g.58836  ORF Transcript_25497/g.58836 Transcript_25497/m.58836 type:complete len:89 (-) Transcript_25497:56-322(-)